MFVSLTTTFLQYLFCNTFKKVFMNLLNLERSLSYLFLKAGAGVKVLRRSSLMFRSLLPLIQRHLPAAAACFINFKHLLLLSFIVIDDNWINIFTSIHAFIGNKHSSRQLGMTPKIQSTNWLFKLARRSNSNL